MRVAKIAWWLGLSALIVALDQATKFWITQALQFGETVVVTSFFNLVLVYNPGAAFSFLSDQSGWQRWFFVALALAVSVWLVALIRRHARELWIPLAGSLILGGALGNVIDRVVLGAVIDFIQWHVGGYYWPAFNVADSAITVGVVLLLWDQFGSRSSAGRTGAAERR
jgi:signal peptidase II